MMRKNVISQATVLLLFVALITVETAATDAALERKIDSLFVIASSGEVKYRDLVEPAQDSIAALGIDAVPILVDKLTTKSARERWTIIWILQKIGSEAVPYLVTALKRSDGLVVQRVCWALGDIGDTAAVQPLIDVTGHSRWQVRDQAIGALGKIGDQRGSEAAVEALGDTIGQVRKAAVVACGKLTVARSVASLVHLLGDSFYGVRLAAAEALLKMDTVDVMAVLGDSLASDNDFVGDLGCRLLGEIGTDEALELLLGQTLSDDPDRRAHAATAIIKADPLDNCGYHRMLTDRETDRFTRLKIQSTRRAVSDVDQ
ncbi:MAG: HEAT repeat domain-containing protein [bacterium]